MKVSELHINWATQAVLGLGNTNNWLQGNSLACKSQQIFCHEGQGIKQHLSVQTPAQAVLRKLPFLAKGLPPQQTHTAKTPNCLKSNLFAPDHKVQGRLQGQCGSLAVPPSCICNRLRPAPGSVPPAPLTFRQLQSIARDPGGCLNGRPTHNVKGFSSNTETELMVATAAFLELSRTRAS